MRSAHVPRDNMAAIRLAVALLVLGQLGGGVEAILWSRTFLTELSIRSFGGIRLCTATPSLSVNVTAQDLYSVQSPSLAGMVYTVRSQLTLYVLGCGSQSPEGIYIYLRAFLVPEVHWDDICANTRSLTIFLSNTGNNDSFTAKPCNYTVSQAGLSTQQVTAWILLTYSADWSPDWVNRTIDYPEGNGAATIILQSDADPLRNATWTNVVTSGLPTVPMTPGQKAQALLASISTADNWWLLICSVLNTSRNLLVSVRSHGSNETIVTYMDCRARTTLVWGAPPTAELAKPTIDAQSSGSWGRELQRQLTTQTFGGIAYCAANSSNSSIIVTATDDILASPGSAIVRGTMSANLAPCSTNTSLATGDAYLKIFLRTEANWTDVCANSVNPVVAVSLTSRTAVQFWPCPQLDPASAAAVASKAAWCILTLNISIVELQWVNRETTSLVQPNATSISFSIFRGETNGTVLQWGNVLVNGRADENPVERLFQVLKTVDTVYWPVICQLVNASVDQYLHIEITGNSNISKDLYGNCNAASELSATPPSGNLSTAETSVTTEGFSSTATATQRTVPSTPVPATATTATTATPTTTTTMLITSMTITSKISTSEETSTAKAITPGQRSGESTSTTTLSPAEQLAIQNKQNLDTVVAQKNNDELRTQIAVVTAALLVLAVLGTFGLCKMVVPRAA